MSDELSAPPTPDDAEWEALARYVAGESAPDEARAVRAWLAADPARVALAAAVEPRAETGAAAPAVDVEAALRRVSARIDGDSRVQLPRDAESRVQLPRDGESPVQPPRDETVERRPRVLPLDRAARRPPEGSRWRGGALKAAAVAAVIAGAGALWTATHREPAGVTSPRRSYATAAGRPDSVSLPDGSRLILGPGSRVDVAAAFAGGAREVVLHGEAYFQVRHDDAHPFTVRAGGATVRDVGTAFVVRTRAGTGAEVAVTEGVVDLGAGNERVRLGRGDRGALDAAGRLRVERAAVGEADVAFTRGRLVFADAPFERVRDDVRRWYGVEVSAAGPSLAARRVTASFENDSAAHVLEVLGLALGADVARRGDTAVFTAR